LPVQPDCNLFVVPAQTDADVFRRTRSVVPFIKRVEKLRLVRVNNFREAIVIVLDEGQPKRGP
jgi:hypothetical protein